MERCFLSIFTRIFKSASSDGASDSEKSDTYYPKQNSILKDSLEVSISKGKEYLSKNAGNHVSVTNANMELWDNFSQLLILEVTKNLDLITLEFHARTWNYFIGKPFGMIKTFPDDFDTTSIGWTVLPIHKEVAHSVINEILELNNEEGIITTYFDPTRPRIDPIVCINVLNLCYHHRYTDTKSLQATEYYIISVLKNRSYLTGTRYYTSPEHSLFFLARLLANKHAHSLRAQILSILQDRIRERVGLLGDALELSMRILAGLSVEVGRRGFGEEGIWRKDVIKLRELQKEDGGWEMGWLCRYGSSEVLIGNRGVTAALAVKVLEEIDRF